MIIHRWTGVESKALREAMHLGVEKFAARTGIAARSVTKWELEGTEARLRPSSQEVLEHALASASPEVVARFERILANIESRRNEPDPGSLPTVTLANDTPGRLMPVVSGAGEIDQVWVVAP
jgi:transcriptional regulator with XRE-family HTH domain